MAQLRNQPARKSVAYFDFSRGLNTKTPKEMIPPNAMPYAKNVLWDEKNRISKIFGTTHLLTAVNNAFATNPIYNLYNYIEYSGTENLIVQGIDASTKAMKLWRVPAATYIGASTTVVDITPSGVTLPTGLRCNFATHKGKLYMVNGTTVLMRWDGSQDNPTTTWKKYHTKHYERFKYLCAWNPSHPRLWGAHSLENPIRVVYSAVNGDDFGPYYGEGINPETGDPYVGDENWMDFPTNDGTPITGLIEFQKTLLVFKPRHIYRIYGDPAYGVTIACVAEGLGCVAHDSIQVRNDGMVVFMAEDGIWAGGDTQLYASPEDQVVRSKMTFTRLTTEIDDYWDSYVTVPDVFGYGEQVWAGATDFADFTLSQCVAVSPISDAYVENCETKIVFDDETTTTEVQTQTTTTTHYVALRSYFESTVPVDRFWYSQTTYVADDGTITRAIPHHVMIYTTHTGTVGASHKLHAYITGTKTVTDARGYIPDFEKIYACGTVSGGTDIKDGDYTTINMSYWPYPQNTYDGSYNSSPLIAIAIVPEGDDDSNYVNWGYCDSNVHDPKSDLKARMSNCDPFVPPTHYGFDYNFRLFMADFHENATVETDGFKCTDASFSRWRNVRVETDDKTFNDYTIRSKLVKVEYDTGGSGGAASWTGSWTETVNAGEISATDLWIKFKFTFYRTASWYPHDDSFSLMRIILTWQNQTTTHQLVASTFWDDRYLLACSVQDSGG